MHCSTQRNTNNKNTKKSRMIVTMRKSPSKDEGSWGERVLSDSENRNEIAVLRDYLHWLYSLVASQEFLEFFQISKLPIH